MLSISCANFSKVYDHRRVKKQEKIAREFINAGEKYRRLNQFSVSLKNYSSAAHIYRAKFDYEEESKVLLKIGYIFTKMRDLTNYSNVIARLRSISSKIDRSQEKILSLEIRKNLEFSEYDIAIKHLKKIISITDGVRRAYYIGKKIDLEKFKNQDDIKALIMWSQSSGNNLENINLIQSPESHIFVNKILALSSKRSGNDKSFKMYLDNCEKIIQYYELTDYSKSIRELRRSNKYSSKQVIANP